MQALFYFLVWLGLPFLIFVYVPLWLSFWKLFPHYLLPLTLLFDYLYHQMIIWPIYSSDDDFFCGRSKGMVEGTLDLLASLQCVMEAALAFTCLLLSDLYTCILAISIALQSSLGTR
jgi:hypothetical protein